ncbi:MAG: zinc ribbon domain-containing protein [Ruminococcus sp.]|nr:zinc ribbon domain-containing protein [Ruminococcus sp.]
MFCRFCGNKLQDSARFCTYCGQSINSAPTPTVVRQVQPIINNAASPNDNSIFLIFTVLALSVVMFAGIFINTMSAYYYKLYAKSEIKKDDYLSMQKLLELSEPDMDISVKTEYGYSIKELRKDKNEHDFSFSGMLKQFYRNYFNNSKIRKSLDEDEYDEIYGDSSDDDDDETKAAASVILLCRLVILLLYLSSSSIMIIIALIMLLNKKTASFFGFIKSSSIITFSGYLLFFALIIVECIADSRMEYNFSNISYHWTYFLFMGASLVNSIVSSIGKKQLSMRHL